MKKQKPYILIFLLLLFARQSPGNEFFRMQEDNSEKVVLFTDRSLYIAGEKVQFSATLFSNAFPANESQILYCELIKPDGNVIANNKTLISNSKAAGCIAIPLELLTGTYYMRAYTRVMRQNGPQSYEYRQIRIINPNRPDVLTTENNQSSITGQFNQVQPLKAADFLTIFVEKHIYASRDTIKLSVEQITGISNRIKSLSLSVVPQHSKSLTLINLMEGKPITSDANYYRETRGLSLVGKLTEASSAVPLIDKRVSLSIIGDGRDFMAARTDAEGRFYFALPGYYGSRDLFLCTEKMPAQTAKIWIDNDFCTLPFHLPAPEFDLSDKERQVVKNMAQNMQITNLFNKSTLNDSIIKPQDTNSFYGKPTAILSIDKYVMLPTLEEYFNELPSQVKVRKRKGEAYFAVQGTANISLYDPLVLVDWVVVDEPSKILAAAPQNISRIEVVNEDYVKGGQTYGGIISFISKKGDFAGIDLPSEGIFVNYRFLTGNQCIFDKTIPMPTNPDARNTILWKPALKIDYSESPKAVSPPSQTWKAVAAEQKSQFEKIIFTAPDTPGIYDIIFEGVTSTGEIFSVTSEIEVTN